MRRKEISVLTSMKIRIGLFIVSFVFAFSACSDNGDIIDENIDSSKSISRPIWLSEINVIADTRSTSLLKITFDYKRIDNKVFIDSVNYYDRNLKLQRTIKFDYDHNNRVSEFVIIGENGNYESGTDMDNFISIPYTYRCGCIHLTYEEGKVTATNLDSNSDETTYNLNADNKVVKETGLFNSSMDWNKGNLKECSRQEYYRNSKMYSGLTTSKIEYYEQNSLDYALMPFPFLRSNNAWKRIDQLDSYGNKFTYEASYVFNEFDYPDILTIVTTSQYANSNSNSHTAKFTYQYINDNNIK